MLCFTTLFRGTNCYVDLAWLRSIGLKFAVINSFFCWPWQHAFDDLEICIFGHWSPVIVTNVRTVQIGLRRLQATEAVNSWVSAWRVLFLIPSLVVLLISQKPFKSGLAGRWEIMMKKVTTITIVCLTFGCVGIGITHGKDTSSQYGPTHNHCVFWHSMGGKPYCFEAINWPKYNASKANTVVPNIQGAESLPKYLNVAQSSAAPAICASRATKYDVNTARYLWTINRSNNGLNWR